jgi:hypothetical protein
MVKRNDQVPYADTMRWSADADGCGASANRAARHDEKVAPEKSRHAGNEQIAEDD